MVMMIGAPTNSPSAYCQPRKIYANAATSIAKFVEANMKARAETSEAPFVNSPRVAESAANEHDDETNPSKAAMASCFGVPCPRCFAAAFFEIKTCITEEKAKPIAKAHRAFQSNPAVVYNDWIIASTFFITITLCI